jgi:hypothetical protein
MFGPCNVTGLTEYLGGETRLVRLPPVLFSSEKGTHQKCNDAHRHSLYFHACFVCVCVIHSHNTHTHTHAVHTYRCTDARSHPNTPLFSAAHLSSRPIAAVFAGSFSALVRHRRALTHKHTPFPCCSPLSSLVLMLLFLCRLLLRPGAPHRGSHQHDLGRGGLW